MEAARDFKLASGRHGTTLISSVSDDTLDVQLGRLFRLLKIRDKG